MIGGAALIFVVALQRARPVEHPGIAFRIDGDAGRITDFHARRHFRPALVHFEHGKTAALRNEACGNAAAEPVNITATANTSFFMAPSQVLAGTCPDPAQGQPS